MNPWHHENPSLFLQPRSNFSHLVPKDTVSTNAVDVRISAAIKRDIYGPLEQIENRIRVLQFNLQSTLIIYVGNVHVILIEHCV